MKIGKKKTAVMTLLVLVFAAAAWSRAAEPEPLEGSQVETITVTAQKRKEDVRTIPVSISVLTDMAIEDKDISSTRDIRFHVPNFTSLNSGSRDYFSRIGIRGISNTAIGDPAVALYIDDVSYADVFSFNLPLFDLERIEVLKGPQGTLYGKNTEAGVVNIITKSPSNILESFADFAIGNYGQKSFSGFVNAPFKEDTLFGRLTIHKSVRDGFVDNVHTGGQVDNHDTLAARGGLVFAPASRLAMDLNLSLTRLDDDGGFPMTPMDKQQYEAASGLSGLDDFQVGYNYLGESSSENATASLRVKYEWDTVDLVSVTALRYMDNESDLDADFTPKELYIGFNARESRSLTQELRLQSGSGDTSDKWLVGLYFSDDDVDHDTGYRLDRASADANGVDLYTEDRISADLGARDMAVFSQGTLRYFDNRLGATAGLRYEHARRTMDRVHTFDGSPSADPMNALEKTYGELLPKLAFDYTLTPDVMVYTSVARGYKAGGYSYAVDDEDMVEFDPEISTAVELGIKAEFPEKRGWINLTGFYTMVDDFQDRVKVDPMTIVQANATEVDIYGIELETAWSLIQGVTLAASLGYTHGVYGKYIDPMTGEDYRDKQITLLPEFDATLSLTWRTMAGFYAGASVYGAGTTYFDRSNTQKQSPYALLNLKAGYEQEKWDIYLAIENVTDRQYFLDAFEDPGVGYMGTVGNPRTITLNCKLRF
ncbi:MAG: TonB-dependent receptor [Desulfobacterales bacterium]|nr:TonB-dependent receptor [Desulfobacterales bacterium]